MIKHGVTVRFGSSLLLCALLAGCHHATQAPIVPVHGQTPSIYVPQPVTPDLPPMQAPPPAVISDTKPIVTPKVKPPKRTKKASPSTGATAAKAAGEPVAPANQPATLGTGTTSALGDLSPGGTSGLPEQKVAEHIADVERRINDLSAAIQDQQKKQIAEIRLFLKQATDALKTGDAEGAGNLATKAGLLLDDVSK